MKTNGKRSDELQATVWPSTIQERRDVLWLPIRQLYIHQSPDNVNISNKCQRIHFNNNQIYIEWSAIKCTDMIDCETFQMIKKQTASFIIKQIKK